MKKILLVLALLLGPLSIARATVTEIDIADFKADVFNPLLKGMFPREIKITFLQEKEQTIIYFRDALGVDGIILSKVEKDLLAGYVDKYFEWKKQATEKGVSLEKEIGKNNAEQSFFQIGSDFHLCHPINVTSTFFTQKDMSYQFVLSMDELMDSENEYLKHKIDDRYFSIKEAKQLRDALSQDALDRSIAVFKKKQAVANDFK
jgi:hypothetical protein